MSKRIIMVTSILFLVILAAAFLTACGSSSSSAISTPTTAGSADGQAIMQQACSRCHSITRVTSAQKTAAQWKITVDRMMARGAKVSPQDEQALIDYLAANYK